MGRIGVSGGKGNIDDLHVQLAKQFGAFPKSHLIYQAGERQVRKSKLPLQAPDAGPGDFRHLPDILGRARPNGPEAVN